MFVRDNNSPKTHCLHTQCCMQSTIVASKAGRSVVLVVFLLFLKIHDMTNGSLPCTHPCSTRPRQGGFSEGQALQKVILVVFLLIFKIRGVCPQRAVFRRYYPVARDMTNGHATVSRPSMPLYQERLPN